MAIGVYFASQSMTAERYSDRLLRLERSLLRLERVNLEILTMMQKLVSSVKKPPADSQSGGQS